MTRLLNFSLLLITANIFISTVSCQRDETIEDNAVGKDVVEATLRTISRSDIFPEDHSFIIRLAYVESRFGANNDTFRTDYYGGIWQVEESVFRITQTNHPRLNPFRDAVRNTYGINWQNLGWRNLLSPLHSAIAASLYFARVPEPIPETIVGQAAHWRKWYRPLGNETEFIEAVREFQDKTKCRGKMDLCIVLDSSGSITPRNYETAKNFTGNMIESFTLDFTRIGMLVYSYTITDIFHIENNYNITEMARRARAAVHLNSGTRTDLGMLRGLELFNETEVIEGVPKVMTVFTDGQSEKRPELIAAVKRVAEQGVKTIAVGIGSGINTEELKLIALNDSQSVFELSDFLSLNDFLFSLTSVTCEVPQLPKLNATYEDSLVKDEKRLYRMSIPTEGITISINITFGNTTGYWSLTEEVPSSAVNDGQLKKSTYIKYPSGRSLRQGEDDDDGNNDGPTVYFSIQGLDERNNYTVAATEGGTEEDDGDGHGDGDGNGDGNGNGGAATISITATFIMVVVSIQLLFFK